MRTNFHNKNFALSLAFIMRLKAIRKLSIYTLIVVMVQQFMLEGPRPCTILSFNVHTTAEYFNKNVSIGQLLQHISKSIVVCARSRAKMLTKTCNNETCLAS